MRATLLSLVAISSQVTALVQSFCSIENTGDGFTPVFNQWQSNGACKTTCETAGYPLAVVQYTQCWCSRYAPSITVPVANCSDPCPGFPDESCGSRANSLFGYVELDGYTPVPVSSTANTPSASIASSSKTTPVQVPTIVVTSVNTVVSTRVNTVVISQTPTNPVTLLDTTTALGLISLSALITTSLSSSTTARLASSSTIPQIASSSSTPQVASSSTTTIIPVPTSSEPPTPVTSTLVITASGAVITQYITTTPSRAASTSQAAAIKPTDKSALSNGAVAGITIGAVLGAAILGALLFLFCRRRRHDEDFEEGSGITRNTSVLSRVGLLRGARAGAPASQQAVLPNVAMAEAPSSPHTRFADTRLNPNALMVHHNASRTSVGTLQDDKDYSRPLEVRNPDTR